MKREIKKSRVKKRIKKKNIIFMVVIILLITIFGGYKYSKYIEEKKHNELVAAIKNNYSKYVKTIRKTKIYKKNLKEIGKISKGINLEVEKERKEDFPYYKIKNTEYYINYKDVSKTKDIEKEETYPNYITLNKNITTNKKVKLYLKEDKFLTTYENLSLPILFIDEDTYYVNYLDKLFWIKKEDVKEVVEHENNKEEEAGYISIINYNNLKDVCTNDDCVSTKRIEEQLEFIKENNYYLISTKEYKNWLNGNVRLKPKAVLLMTQNENDIIKNMNEKYNHVVNVIGEDTGIKFLDNNNKTTKESKLENLPRYNVGDNTTMEDFKKMLLGEVVQAVKKEEKINNTGNEERIAVINYHFFYDGTKEGCNENICLDIKNFREELDYLRDNNYKTLTMEEYRKWKYGEIELPEKSVLLTIDDGAFGTGRHNGNHLIPILEEYKMHATLFLIAGWWDINNYRSDYLDIESHTFDMHNRGDCGKAQMICYGYDHLVEDLQKSVQVIGSKKAFCFPFYTYDDEAISAVKDVGFELAFIGGNRKSKRSDYNFKIPRYPIYKDTSLEQFINMVS